MGKKANLPPGAGNKSQQKLASRNRRNNLVAYARRHAGLVAVAVAAWACKAYYPKAKAYFFPKKRSSRRGKADAAADRGAEWAVLLSKADGLVAKGAVAEGIAVYREAINAAPKLSPAHTNLCAA